MRWRLVSPEALAWREFEGELVVRNPHSGSTHLLEPLAAEIFRMLLDAPAGLNAAELAARLREDGEPQDEWYASAGAVLEEFKRLGLAEAY